MLAKRAVQNISMRKVRDVYDLKRRGEHDDIWVGG